MPLKACNGLRREAIARRVPDPYTPDAEGIAEDYCEGD